MNRSQPETMIYATLGRATWWGTKRVVKRRIKGFSKNTRSLPILGVVVGAVAVSTVAALLLTSKTGGEQNDAAQ